MDQETESSLVRVMAWHLFGAKPLPESMMTYRHSNTWHKLKLDLKHIVIIFIPKNKCI